MAKPRGSKLAKCANCGKRYFLLPSVARTCGCGATVSVEQPKASG